MLHMICISRVPNQNGVSLLYIMLEIHHSGREPSVCLRPGHLNVGVGESWRCREETVKILNCAFQCNYWYLSAVSSVLPWRNYSQTSLPWHRPSSLCSDNAVLTCDREKEVVSFYAIIDCCVITSTKSNGKRRSEMKTCMSKRDRTSGQADTAEEEGLDRTHPQEASIQHHTPSPDLEPAGEEKEAGLSTVGSETLKQNWNSKGPTGAESPEQPRTDCDGEGSWMVYAPPGAMGISK